MTPEKLEQLADQIESRMNELKTSVGMTSGRPSSTALVSIEDIAARNKCATWPNGNDNDPSGREFRKAITESILAGDPSAKFSEMTKPYYNDLNDMHLNKPLSPEAVMKTVNSNRALPETKRFNQSRHANEIYSEANVRKAMEAYNRDHPNSKVNLDDYRGVGFTDAEVKQFKASISELKATHPHGEAKNSNEIAKLSHIVAQPSAFQRPPSTFSKPTEKTSEEIRLEEKPRSVEPKTSQSNSQEQTVKTTVQPSNRGFTRPAVTMRQAEAAASARQQKAADEARAREAAARRTQEEAERTRRGYSM